MGVQPERVQNAAKQPVRRRNQRPSVQRKLSQRLDALYGNRRSQAPGFRQQAKKKMLPRLRIPKDFPKAKRKSKSNNVVGRRDSLGPRARNAMSGQLKNRVPRLRIPKPLLRSKR